MFATSSPDLLKTVMLGNGTGFRASSHGVFTWVLQNPDTGASFTVLQQVNTPSMSNTSTSVTLTTSAGTFTVPGVELYGRQSKILVTDYALDQHNKSALLYSSVDIATSENFGHETALVLYLKEGQTGEFAFRGDSNLTYTVFGSLKVTAITRQPRGSSSPQQAFTYTQSSGASAVLFSNDVLVYILDQATAWRFWAPRDGDNSFDVAGSSRVFILGPYLVRSARIDWTAGVLYVLGDNDSATTLEAFVGSGSGKIINTVNWNGKTLPATRTPYGSYRAAISGGQYRVSNGNVTLPQLTEWHAADSLPETQPDYDDSRWTVCNHTTTHGPVPPVTLPVLFASDYGFYVGAKVYRGRFLSTGPMPSAVNITASGGQGFGWTAWVNGHLLGGSPGVAGQATTSALLKLPTDVINIEKGRDNVLTVLVDYHGHDETSTRNGLNNPRGLLGAKLLFDKSDKDKKSRATAASSGFTTWKIMGNAGGSANIDPVRGPMNEGGLYGERLGWHLPGFSAAADSKFSKSSPTDGIKDAGVQFYVTEFMLSVPTDLDVPLGIELAAPVGTIARVQLWINGYQYGKYVPHIGPQTRFPVPPGILNMHGNNTLALSLWAMTSAGARLDKVALVGYSDGGDGKNEGRMSAYETSFFANIEQWAASSASLQLPWTDRSEFA
ncbi:beta-galactosidase [Sporothrix schenckii 1099-18]|uniref:Beta-galactosidase n=1 Tax=Sporothrix schenckii 1099-18 TaxID=1397361 RepID=A0A0F2LTI8_SPOSC|nr:beta-galactosidase [Sporothrix schenckii 1099-18]KJR80793.1 beta-galactosidase [Sporothrix schenckii 1099-18]